MAGVVELTRRMVAAAPERPEAWEKLGNVLRMVSDDAGSIATLRDGCARFPDHAGLHLQLARSAMTAGMYEEALAAVDTALRLESALPGAVNLRFQALVKLGMLEDAEGLVAQCVSAGGAQLALFHFAVGRARARDEWQPLLALCDGILANSPGNTGARYYKALALLRLGRAKEAELNPRQFLSQRKLPVDAEFVRQVRGEILANPTLAADPRGFTTTHGMQTRQLLQSGDVALPALCRQIEAAVDRYEQELVASGVDDPFITDRPKRVSLTPWAVVYPGEGRQRSHIHAPGWVSGIYYVAAPLGGHLLLGAMNADDAPESEVPWAVERIQPEANLLVLFPSFIPHATEATHAEELRICVAFDVVPE